MCKFRETIPLRSRHNKPRIFFHDHDGYQKNPLSMQISKKSSYRSGKMHLEKVAGKNVMKHLYRAPEKGWAIFVSKYIALDECCHKGKFTLLESVSKEDSFQIHHDHIKWKKNSWLFTVDLGLIFVVVFRIGFLANFHNIWNLTLKCYKNCFTDSEKCETT
jgi:hypothetical protein